MSNKNQTMVNLVSKHLFQLIPASTDGKHNEISTDWVGNTIGEARYKFKQARQRLLDPGSWQQLTGGNGASFEIRGHSAGAQNSKKGDYIKINVPGPGPANGRGFDWVTIENLLEFADIPAESEAVGMILRSSADPLSANDDTAHFFTDAASSTLILQRQSHVVTCMYFGRNEKPNIHTHSVSSNIRNAVVAAGALLGVSEIQWTALVKGLLS